MDIHSSPTEQLFSNVVNGGYCIGCGACAAVAGSPITMRVNEFGCIQPYIDSARSALSIESNLLKVCPFSGEVPDEDEIARTYFSGDNPNYDNRVGYYSALYAGYVNEGDFRENGSSGGMATWCVAELLKNGNIDGVVHVHSRQPDVNDRRLFHYQLSTSLEQICANTKSQYYPIEFSKVAQIVRERPGRYAFVGIPCFVKAMRLLMQQDDVIASRVIYCVSLVCGHLKSMRWTDLLGWQVGIRVGTINSIGFREKAESIRASDYYFKLTSQQDGHEVTKRIQVWPLLGGDWSSGYFMYDACNYCDDVVGETSDISIGDAWLPQYSNDPKGTNLVIIRNSEILELIESARKQGRLHLEDLTLDQAVQSQSGGFRQRRDGLAYRLWLKKNSGEWYPKKRVDPNRSHLSFKRRHIFKLRMKIAHLSHFEYQKAIQNGNLEYFLKRLRPITMWYKAVNRQIRSDLVNRIKQLIRI